jgi:dTDP-4-dehydrorhamnose 3,5-epimerase
MTVKPLALPGVFLIETPALTDERGFFIEAYKASTFRAHSLPTDFLQDNHSCSVRGVLRGLHYQLPPHAQGKLVRVVEGRIWDVAVDVRRGSPTFGQSVGVELSDARPALFWIPPGFAHGFVVLSEKAHFLYKCTAEYHRPSERGIRWDDPTLAVSWPSRDVRISPKDAALPLLAEAELPDWSQQND